MKKTNALTRHLAAGTAGGTRSLPPALYFRLDGIPQVQPKPEDEKRWHAWRKSARCTCVKCKEDIEPAAMFADIFWLQQQPATPAHMCASPMVRAHAAAHLLADHVANGGLFWVARSCPYCHCMATVRVGQCDKRPDVTQLDELPVYTLSLPSGQTAVVWWADVCPREDVLRAVGGRVDRFHFALRGEQVVWSFLESAADRRWNGLHDTLFDHRTSPDGIVEKWDERHVDKWLDLIDVHQCTHRLCVDHAPTTTRPSAKQQSSLFAKRS